MLMEAARAQLDSERVLSFLDDKLTSEAYGAVLNRADAVLAPYWCQVYVSRTSGIVAEALAVGKPMIVTEDTWLSDQIAGKACGLTT